MIPLLLRFEEKINVCFFKKTDSSCRRISGSTVPIDQFINLLVTKYHRLRGLNNRCYFLQKLRWFNKPQQVTLPPHSSGGWTFRIMDGWLCGRICSRPFSLSLRWPYSCSYVVPPVCVCLCPHFLSYKDTREFPLWLSSNKPNQYPWVQFLAPLSGLRIQHRRELWHRLQMWLESHISMAVVQAGNCSSDSTSSLGTSICYTYSPKKMKKQDTSHHGFWNYL